MTKKSCYDDKEQHFIDSLKRKEDLISVPKSLISKAFEKNSLLKEVKRLIVTPSNIPSTNLVIDCIKKSVSNNFAKKKAFFFINKTLL